MRTQGASAIAADAVSPAVEVNAPLLPSRDNIEGERVARSSLARRGEERLRGISGTQEMSRGSRAGPPGGGGGVANA